MRTFGTTTAELLALREWLGGFGVTHVARESTGVCWKPIFYVLEDAFTCVLANAAQITQVPGRKTDVKDGVWIAQLLEHGLVRGSFVPPASIRELRDLTRYRAALIGEPTRETNRLQKVLEDTGIKCRSCLAIGGLAMPARPDYRLFRECCFVVPRWFPNHPDRGHAATRPPTLSFAKSPSGRHRDYSNAERAARCCRAWRKWLDRRSQRGHMSWERFGAVLRRYPLPAAWLPRSVYRLA